MSQNNFEAVTIQLPKTALAYLRFKAELNKVSVERQAELEIMDVQNAEFEDMRAYEYLELSSFKQAYDNIRSELSIMEMAKTRRDNIQ